jgi:hypothetical protein
MIVLSIDEKEKENDGKPEISQAVFKGCGSFQINRA